MRQVIMYKCPICKFIGRKKEVEKCESQHKTNDIKEAKAKELSKNKTKLKNSVRLSATSLKDIKKLLISKSKEIFGLNLSFTNFNMPFGKVSNTHYCPIKGVTNWSSVKGKHTDYLGWYGGVEGKVSGKSKIKVEHFGDDDDFGLITEFFNGISIGTGCDGDEFGIDLYLFLDDFPKIKRKYKLYSELLKKAGKFEKRKEKIEIDFYNLFQKTQEEDKELIKIEKELQLLETRQEERNKEIEDSLRKKKKTVSASYNYDKKKLKELTKEILG